MYMLVLLGYLKAVGAHGFAFVDVEGPADLNPALLEAEEGPDYPAVNQHEPGEPMAFECGRFDMGHHCSAEEDVEMEVAEQCQLRENGATVPGSFVGCCRQVRINFLNQNFKKTPVVVASVLRPAELAHATFSTTIKRHGTKVHSRLPHVSHGSARPKTAARACAGPPGFHGPADARG